MPPSGPQRFGMIAGNGRFPILALEAARSLGMEIVAIGIEEEASREIETLAARSYWVSLGSLSRLIDICKDEGVSRVMMCGQVKHTKIFSAIRPDWRLFKLLASLDAKNTDALIGGVARVLREHHALLEYPFASDAGHGGVQLLDRRQPARDAGLHVDAAQASQVRKRRSCRRTSLRCPCLARARCPARRRRLMRGLVPVYGRGTPPRRQDVSRRIDVAIVRVTTRTTHPSLYTQPVYTGGARKGPAR